MTITAILAAIGGILTLIIGFFAGHKVASVKTASAVAKATTETEATTRATVAQETAVAAGQAMSDAADVRQQATSQAQAEADQGRQALIDAMRKDGEIQ